jgi:hypothetical protein
MIARIASRLALASTVTPLPSYLVDPFAYVSRLQCFASSWIEMTVGLARAIRYAAAVSFGSSIVPLNLGGSSSIPKFSE